jgi:SAM-dependent methyltransferase
MDERFAKTRHAADAHFWYHGFRRFITPVLEEVADGRSNLRILDCGCGVGQNLPMLARYGHSVGLELEPVAAAAGREFGRPIACADITRIPFSDNAFDLTVSFDVLQVIEPDLAAVREMARVVRPGGRVVLTMAAFDILSGDHSEVWNECRRYTPRTARALAEIMFAVRTTQRVIRPFRDRPSHSDIDVPWAPVNSALILLLDGEAALSRYLPMPVGTSLVVVARKP